MPHVIAGTTRLLIVPSMAFDCALLVQSWTQSLGGDFEITGATIDARGGASSGGHF